LSRVVVRFGFGVTAGFGGLDFSPIVIVSETSSYLSNKYQPSDDTWALDSYIGAAEGFLTGLG